MGISHRIPNGNSLINRIFTGNNYNNTGIATSGVYAWYTSRYQQGYFVEDASVSSPASRKRRVIRDNVKGTQCPGV
jgi:hypothetical protein